MFYPHLYPQAKNTLEMLEKALSQLPPFANVPLDPLGYIFSTNNIARAGLLLRALL